jgi:hypothetical protein
MVEYLRKEDALEAASKLFNISPELIQSIQPKRVSSELPGRCMDLEIYEINEKTAFAISYRQVVMGRENIGEHRYRLWEIEGKDGVLKEL